MKATKPISRPARLGASVYDVLLDRLMSREIEPGERIAVDALVREFGVSQTPIREALSQLEAQHLVVKTHLIGYRAAPHFSAKDYENLYELRRLLEPKAAARAAAAMTDEALAELVGHNDRMASLQQERGLENFNQFGRMDVEFHSLIALGSDNRFIADSIVSWGLQFHLFRRGYHPQWLGAVLGEHMIILNHIKNRAPERAEASMLLHLDNSYKRYRETLA